MSSKQRSYPYPVLTKYSDDIQDCDFQVSLIPGKTRTHYVLTAIARISSPDIQALIGRHEACYAVQVQCPATLFRRLYTSNDEQFKVEIPAVEVDGRVQLQPMIVATCDILAYQNRHFHVDYDGMSFSIRKGDVLAIDDEREFDADKQEDVLLRVPSIFSIRRGNDSATPMDVQLGSQKITILLPPESFEFYTDISRNIAWQPVVSASIIVPALVHVLHVLSEEDDDSRWYRVLRRKLHDIGVDIRDTEIVQQGALRYAQQLIGEPTREGLRTMAETLNETDSEEGE